MYSNEQQGALVASTETQQAWGAGTACALFFLSVLVLTVRCLKNENISQPMQGFRAWRKENKSWLEHMSETNSGGDRYADWMEILRESHPLGDKVRVPLLDVISFLEKRARAFDSDAFKFDNLEIISDISSFATSIFAVLNDEFSQPNSTRISSDEIRRMHILLMDFHTRIKRHSECIMIKLQPFANDQKKLLAHMPDLGDEKVINLSIIESSKDLPEASRTALYIAAISMTQYCTFGQINSETVCQKLLSSHMTKDDQDLFRGICTEINTYQKALSYKAKSDFPTNIQWHRGISELLHRTFSLFKNCASGKDTMVPHV